MRAWSRPYVVFEGTYVVRDGSSNRTVLDLDREGVRIAVAEGATYDAYLRERCGMLVWWARTFKGALELFAIERLDAVAGLKQALAAFAMANVVLHVIDGRFAAIEHAVAVPKGHRAGLRYLKAFVDEITAGGRVGVDRLSP